MMRKMRRRRRIHNANLDWKVGVIFKKTKRKIHNTNLDWTVGI